jgi:GNAT superfamily N-acetyltransferase
MPDAILGWRGEFENPELNALHAECFEHRLLHVDWRGQVERHSLGWVAARLEGRLAGFVSVAWDGDVHAFLLDTMVTGPLRRQGLATRIVAEAVQRAQLAGCEWMHVDFEPHLRDFYIGACGFPPAGAGVMGLR